MSVAEQPSNVSTAGMRRILPPEVVERGPDPFAPPPGLRGGGPVRPLDLLNGARAWLVTGFEEARTVLSDARFSADKLRHRDATSPRPPAEPPRGARADGAFVFMDPPEHTRLRRPLTSQFTVRRMRELESRVREIAVGHIEAMRAAGTQADLVPAFALPLPSLVICELLGVDYADRAEFQERTAVGLSASATPAEQAVARAGLHAFMGRLVSAKRAKPADDLLSGLVHDTDPPLTDAQLTDVALLLLTAGHETTANMLGLGTFALLEHPDQLAALRAEPGLIDNAVEELLRYLSIIQLGVSRVATEPVTLGGVDLPAGATVVIATPEVNRDPRHWTDPDVLDLRRPRTPHLAFGHGVHQCLGQQLARIELRIGLGELLSRLPGLRLAVPAGQVPLRDEMLVFGVRSLPVTWS
ncbi:cytochrome P450 [Nonomuraea gerenzanensis]|uniref:Putative cytochrome P450 hydroxylase n=1 Tax=Nonomuraea gerenzanensis TaxID=93944 RepID=A0A1M4EGD1_9ACTN|nr:cytochrome P450 [Nonomuraea gerenzanensis]UBU09210.1 cytochrome P450 [Nonomuraea gerenzanensis]SBO97603.1 putative cytochrome P450 hydroxylase [Nonomuraea gerenzanensis]